MTLPRLSDDPITGKDFEGYRIYRSTDPGWNDMEPITDSFGAVTFRKPLAQFDLDNEYSGYSPIPIKGVHYWMGSNTGSFMFTAIPPLKTDTPTIMR